MKIWIIAFWIVSFTVGCGNANSKNELAAANTSTETKVDGAKIFKQSCALCHGNDGKLGANGSKDLTVSTMDLNERIAIISNGKGMMTPFSKILDLKQIKAVAEYTMTLK